METRLTVTLLLSTARVIAADGNCKAIHPPGIVRVSEEKCGAPLHHGRYIHQTMTKRVLVLGTTRTGIPRVSPRLVKEIQSGQATTGGKTGWLAS